MTGADTADETNRGDRVNEIIAHQVGQPERVIEFTIGEHPASVVILEP